MSFSQAERFEQHITNQLSKWLGAMPVLLPILRRLEVAESIDERCPGKEEVSHGTTVLTLVLNRLMAPKPMYKVSEWVKETVLEDALGLSAEQMHDARLGRTLDDIHPHLAKLWQDIVVQAVLAYGVDVRFLHYDITSVYFEGEYSESEKVSYGHSRDHRPDAKQVNLAVNVNGEAGIPLAYRVLAGRTADRTTPVDNLEALRALLKRPELVQMDKDFLLISDRAMLDHAVIMAYQEKRVRWLGPLPAEGSLLEVMRSVSEQELAVQPLDYRPLNQPAEEALRYQGVLRFATIEHEGRQAPIQILVVKSHTKVKLDREHRQTCLKRLMNRLKEIKGHLNTRRYKRRDYTWVQIESARRGNSAQDLLDIELTGEDGNLRLTYHLNQERLSQAEALDGRYLLGTNDRTLSALPMLTLFKEQDLVERRIKVIKGPLRIRPLFLHKEKRIEALVFVAMVALLVYTILEMLCRRAGLPITTRQVLERFERLAAVYLLFSDGSQLRLPSGLNHFQEQLIGLLKFQPPGVYLSPREATQ